jgi:flavin reductase (DIM6/NTAB) family NADH-FMN oxidoreductase RutF
MHVESRPAILYFGTPVVLISTVNEDGSYNLAPMSSAWWLGWRCLLGLSAVSKTPANMRRTGECVLNLPSISQVEAVDCLARTTGSNPVPEGKLRRGYRHVADKFGIAGLTPVPAKSVAAPRVLECPVNLEADVVALHDMAEDDPKLRGRFVAVEINIKRVLVDQRILLDGDCDRIDSDKWQPLIMSFQNFYGLGADRLHPSELANIPESAYRL